MLNYWVVTKFTMVYGMSSAVWSSTYLEEDEEDAHRFIRQVSKQVLMPHIQICSFFPAK